jgi:hypothetical protein
VYTRPRACACWRVRAREYTHDPMMSCMMEPMITPAPEPRLPLNLAVKLEPDTARLLRRTAFETGRSKRELVEAAILKVYGEGERAA